jgi:hypothetical protein
MKALPLPQLLAEARQMTIFDHFTYYSSGGHLTSVLNNSGTATAGDSAGGRLSLTSSGGSPALNDESYVKSTNQLFLFAASKPLLFESKVQFSEANTNKANIVAGFMSGVAAGAMQNGSAGPKTSFSGAVIYKIGNGTVWRFMTSMGSTQTDAVSQHTAGGSADQTLTIECNPVSSTLIECVPFLNGVQFLDANNKPIKQTITLNSPAQMNAFFGVKTGSSSLETLVADYLAATQLV